MAKIQLQKQRFTVAGNQDVMIGFDIDEDKIVLYNERGGMEFVFKNSNDMDTLKRWKEVIKCMGQAVNFALTKTK